MGKFLKKAKQVVPGYNLYETEGLAVLERSCLVERASKHGDTDLQSTWLALSDAIAFTGDFLPPDLVLVVTRPVNNVDLVNREGVADGR